MLGIAMSDAERKPILVTISISHYCEKARWALDRAGIAYDERRHLPAIHRVAVKRAGGRQTAPVLVCDDGTVVDESSDIVVYADGRAPAGRGMIPADPALAAEARALADDFDERLGPATRLWVYHEMFDYPELDAGADDRRRADLAAPHVSLRQQGGGLRRGQGPEASTTRTPSRPSAPSARSTPTSTRAWPTAAATSSATRSRSPTSPSRRSRRR